MQAWTGRLLFRHEQVVNEEDGCRDLVLVDVATERTSDRAQKLMLAGRRTSKRLDRERLLPATRERAGTRPASRFGRGTDVGEP